MEPTIIGKLLAMGCLIVALNLNSVDAQIPTESRWLNFEARGLCQIIDEPYVYSGQCEIGINRLLARSVATYGLS